MKQPMDGPPFVAGGSHLHSSSEDIRFSRPVKAARCAAEKSDW